MTRDRFEPASGFLMVKVPDDYREAPTQCDRGEVVRGGHHDYGPSWDQDGKQIRQFVQWDYRATVGFLKEAGDPYVVVRASDVIGKWVKP